MRREGVVVGRGGSGVEVNNGGVVGANYERASSFK